MTKLSFLLELHKKLSALPSNEVEERLKFYIEMIEDRMEEGVPEEDAVAAVGSVDEIASQIIADISPDETNTPAKGKRKFKAWEIVLLALGSPIWASLLIAAFAVVFSLYASLWAVIVSLWAVFGSVAACALGGVLGGIIFVLWGHISSGIALIGSAFICAGVSIFLFIGCKYATAGSVFLTKLPFKRKFSNKEEVQK